jgi:hypothetical protein
MFYATTIYKDEQATECNQFGAELGVNDLHRFETKKERDQFVDKRDYAQAITRKEAEHKYKEQFAFWKK